MRRPAVEQLTPKVCVVEDDPGIREAMIAALTMAGFSVIAPEDLRRTISFIRSEMPAIVLMDLLLSGEQSSQMITQLKADLQLKTLPIIVSSAHMNGAALAAQAGADDFLEKPFNISDLLAMVTRHLDRPKMP